MNQESAKTTSQTEGTQMSEKEQRELERFRKIPERISKQHQQLGDRGSHEENMQSNELQQIRVDDSEEGHNDPILRFVEEGDKILFGVSEEETEKWDHLPLEIRQKALEFYALLRHYFDKGEDMKEDERAHLEEHFKAFLRTIRDSSSDESEEARL